MVRICLIMLQMLSLLLFNIRLGGDLSMKVEVPGQINAGKEIRVQVTLDKADIKGFSRFQMELPAGLTATNVFSANADFSFKDQKVRLVWLRMPEEKTVTFSFNVRCDERLKGNFDLVGKFSYIDENERKTLDIQPQAVAIVPSSSIDPKLIVDIKDFGKQAMPQLMEASGNQIACVRQKPEWNEAKKEYIVTLLVNKESLKKFAKIEESVPAGFTAVNVDSKEGIFTFKDGKAKFLWMNLPADPYFTVSYKLVPSKNVQASKQPVVAGVFSYILDDKSQSVTIVEKDVKLANLTPAAVKGILKSAPMIAAVEQAPAVDTEKTGKNLAATTTQKPIKVIPRLEETADLLGPQMGVYYRVQLAAGHKPVNIKSYFRKYKLDSKVFTEKHQGWIKYSVGSFPAYKDARDYRIHIWNTTSIADAFVSAYNNGKRITVQEALMIGNQKWIQ